MKKALLSATIVAASFFAVSSDAQCPAGRYLTDMFSVSKSTVTYSTPYNLQADIYQPTGDTIAARPLIILGHGGSFIGGTRADDATVDSLCVRFARRGYVTVSIDYRLGTLTDLAVDSTAIDVVMKAISDGKAAIRYFVKDAATTNTYKIDTNNIFVGGNSAGAVLYMHVGYLDESEAPSYITTALSFNGGFEGNSGNAGYTTKYKAVINLAGALNMAAFIDPTDVPSVNIQGSADATVPYNCGHPLGGIVPVDLCGLGVLEPAYVAKAINHWSKVYTGDAHVPWASNPAKFNTVDSMTREFLYTQVCPSGASVQNITATGSITTLYPNPASEAATVHASSLIESISVYDPSGRIAFSRSDINNTEISINTSHFAKGLYFVRVNFADVNTTPVIKRLVIE